tara:strand:+ start:3025 stop:3336 length:312 start_codon:yes stop_codon:yes gene_type:complete
MATSKVKGTSKKIKELTGRKPEKITKEELHKVQKVINKVNQIQLEIGVLESRKHNLLHDISLAQDILNQTQKEFEKEYGTSDINIQDGTINYQKENGKVNKKD